MRLYHVTTKANHGSIVREGIDPKYSRGARRESWFVVPSLLAWAMLHVQVRHNADLEDIIAFECLIPPSKLTRRRRGIYTSYESVTPLFFVDSASGLDVARSYPMEASPERPEAK